LRLPKVPKAEAAVLGRRVLLIGVAGILSAATTNCLTPLDPARVPVGAVRVTLGDRALTVDTLGVRRTARVNAVAIARDGYELPITTFRFASSNEAVATVDSSGVVLAIAPGNARVAAIAPDGTRGEATVVVVPSTVDYDISVGGAPRAITFSPDYTKAYVAVAGGSIVFLDAIGFFRTTTLTLSDEVGDVAATPSLLYATHPNSNAVSVIATATRELQARISLDGSPAAAVAYGSRVWIAEPTLRRIAIIDGASRGTSLAVSGEPSRLALNPDASRLYASVHDANGWSLVMLDASTGAEQLRVALPGEAVALAVGNSSDAGERVYAAVPVAGQLLELALAGGRLSIERTTSIAAKAGGIAARASGTPLVVVSGSPLGIFDGASLNLLDSIENAGSGCVAMRPDGLFVFVGAPEAGAVRVIGL
jgi:DNA-binding beta-propeller fold protein YncE